MARKTEIFHFRDQKRLLDHQDDADIDEPITIDESQMAEFGLKSGGSLEEGGSVSQSERTPMTDEEKKAAVEALKAKIAAKRAEKAKAAEVDEVDREKQRREMGQRSAQTYSERKEAQEKMEAARRAREKQAEKDYLAKLKEQVRLEREQRNAKTTSAAEPAAPVAAPVAAAPAAAAPAPEYTECQLQIRLTNGQALKASFLPANTILDVVNYVSQHRTDGYGSFVLMTTFPKMVFDSSEKMDMTLLDASTIF